jgi:hypothetical protein
MRAESISQPCRCHPADLSEYRGAIADASPYQLYLARRDLVIAASSAAGLPVEVIADAVGLSPRRVHAILARQRRT